MSLEQATALLVLMLVAQIPLLVTAIVNWLKNQSNGRAIEVIKKSTEEIHKATDGMKDALVAGASREGFAAGIAAELERTKPHQSNQGGQ